MAPALGSAALCALLLTAVLAASGCAAPPDQAASHPMPPGAGHDAPPVPPAAVDPVRFLLFGDMGTGQAGQYRTAAAMTEVCLHLGCSFAITTGDNIYSHGVAGPYDPQFETKFEHPYAGLDFPFYMVLGNHDNGHTGGRTFAPGDHQVAYHDRKDRLSDKWQMPARHYAFQIDGIRFLALDTEPLHWMHDPTSPAGPLAMAQTLWLEQELAAPWDGWTFAFGHHPYISNGRHGDAGTAGRGAGLKSVVEEHLCGRVDFYLAGHDHDLQWLEETPACPGTGFLVSGAAANPRPLADPDRHPARFQQGDTLGFFWVQLDGDTMTVRAYGPQAELLFEGTHARTRSG